MVTIDKTKAIAIYNEEINHALKYLNESTFETYEFKLSYKDYRYQQFKGWVNCMFAIGVLTNEEFHKFSRELYNKFSIKNFDTKNCEDFKK